MRLCGYPEHQIYFSTVTSPHLLSSIITIIASDLPYNEVILITMDELGIPPLNDTRYVCYPIYILMARNLTFLARICRLSRQPPWSHR